RERPWRSILRSVPFEELPSLFSKHKQWIRDLNMDDVAVLNAVLKAHLTDLRSLTVGYLSSSISFKLNEEFDHDQVPFSPSSILPSGVETLQRHVYKLTPGSKSFLTSVFSTLAAIRHLNIGKRADDFLLSNMTTLLPTLESFVHSGQTAVFDYKTLASSTPHHNLRSLAFTHESISHHQLRSIVLTFPLLQILSAYGCYGKWTPGATTAQLCPLEHAFLRTFLTRNTTDLTAIEKAKLIIETGHVEKATAMFQQLFILFPVLDCLEARGAYWGEKKVAKAREPPARVYPLTGLLFSGRGQDHFRAHVLVLQMPFLVRLKVGLVSLTDLNVIASTCSDALVYSRFSLRDNWSADVCKALATCSRLKERLDDGHVILAEDIINGPDWTCMGL
ncbi:hypothetical protein BG015_003808, partial [Linnemannia schmuckeri]